MPLSIDTELPEDVRILIKAAYWLSEKSFPVYDGQGRVKRYSVPIREMERVRAKVGKLVEHE